MNQKSNIYLQQIYQSLLYQYMQTIMFLILFAFLILCISYFYFANSKLDKCFYNVNEVCQNLNNIDLKSNAILKETINVMNKNMWNDWPEKHLYDGSGKWKIFPFYAFGIWENENCNLCPTIHAFLKQIPNLRLATLSKLTPKMKLKPHMGWGSHSNHVIRCHYGLVVPNNCYISVKNNDNESLEEIQYHKQFEWLLFDDSKIHYAENKSNEDRIVLIIDIERPNNIEIGKSQIGDTKELVEIINYFKQKNKQ